MPFVVLVAVIIHRVTDQKFRDDTDGSIITIIIVVIIVIIIFVVVIIILLLLQIKQKFRDDMDGMAAMLQKADKKNLGYIGPAAFKKLLTDLGIGLRPGDLKVIMAAFDGTCARAHAPTRACARAHMRSCAHACANAFSRSLIRVCL